MTTNFQIVSEISVKAKSKVYLITIDDTPTFYVIKQYRDRTALPTFEQLREIVSIHLPRIHDLWSEGDEVCVIEEYVAGKTLREIIDEGQLTIEDAKKYMSMLCEAMRDLHSNKPMLVHRDIKPENIIIDKNCVLKLIDFDATRVYKSEEKYDTVLIGTREYASPEQFGYQQTDERSDIYSAGVVFKELVSGISMSRGINRSVQKIIDKATMFEPEKRYSSAEAMLNDIKLIGRVRPVVWKCLAITAAVAILVCGACVWHNKNITKDTDDYVTDEIAVSSEADVTKAEGEQIESVPIADAQVENEQTENSLLDNGHIAGSQTENLPIENTQTENENTADLNSDENEDEVIYSLESDFISDEPEIITMDDKTVYYDQGEVYCIEDDHCIFWGFEDGRAYPRNFHLSSEYNGLPVTEIGDFALRTQKGVRKIHIPSSVTHIGENAFNKDLKAIYGEAGSYIEEYCKENGYKFIPE